MTPTGGCLAARVRDTPPMGLAAYNRLQTALMRRFIQQGGSAEAWCERLAPAFRRRYGWLCPRAATGPEPVRTVPGRAVVLASRAPVPPHSASPADARASLPLPAPRRRTA